MIEGFSIVLSNIFSNKFVRRYFLWLLLILGGVIYGQTLTYPFVHDDFVFIHQNPSIESINVSALFSKTAIANKSSVLINAYYRPLLEFIYRLEYRFFHLTASGYHAVNVGLHVINAYLIYLLAQTFLQKGASEKRFPLLVALSAIIFLVHPVQTEAVACISGISNLVMAMLLLACLCVYSKARCYGGRWSLVWYSLALFLFIGALLAKEQAVVLPGIIILWEWMRCEDEGWWPKQAKPFLLVLGFVGVVMVYFGLRLFFLGSVLGADNFAGKELVLRLCSLPRIMMTYAELVFYPNQLHYYRSVDLLQSAVWPSIALLGVSGVASWALIQTQGFYRRVMVFGLGWFVIFLVPVLNIIPMVNEYSFVLTAEHFVYLPMWGGILFVGAFCCARVECMPIWGQRLGVIGVGGLLVFLSLVSMRQHTFWRGEIPLFQRAIRFESQLSRVHILLGRAYYLEGFFKEAIEEYERAIDILQGYVDKVDVLSVRQFYQGLQKGAYFDLAHAFESIGRLEDAAKSYSQAIRIDPRDMVLHNNLGVVFIWQQQWDLAAAQFQLSLAIEQNVMAMSNLAFCWIQQGRKHEAEELLRTIINKDPKNQLAQKNLTLLLSLPVEAQEKLLEGIGPWKQY